MVVVSRTDDEPVTSRLDYWHQLVCDTLVPLDMHTDSPGDYRGSLVHADLDGVQFTELTAAPLHVTRTATMIRRSDPELYKIEMHTRGQSVLQRAGQETVLRSGDIALVDTGHPYRMAAGYPSFSTPRTGRARGLPQLVTLMVPRSMVPIEANALPAAADVRPVTHTAAGGLAAAALAQVASSVSAGEEATAARLARVVLDLLAIGLAQLLDRPAVVAPETRQQAMLSRVKAFIEHNLGDPGLTPSRVAAAHHISLRQLYRLFAPESTTVAEWIRARRLERCRQQLADPAMRDRPVGAVAARCGFTSAAHFNRLFHATYGLTPGAYRWAHPASQSADADT